MNRCWLVKYWGGGEYTRSGIPDILCCCKGYFLGIEVKSKTGKPSALQIRNLRNINKAGGYAILLYPKDWIHFVDLVEGMKYGDPEMVEKEYQYLMQVWIRWYEKFKKEGVL